MTPGLVPWFVACVLLTFPFVVQASPLQIPDPPSGEMVRQFLDGHSPSGTASLQRWLGLDMKIRRRDGKLNGRMIRVSEVYVCDRAGVDDAASITTTDSPRIRLEDINAVVRRGDEILHYRREDLRWIEATTRHRGVVYLDETACLAMIPGVRTGDRVRVVEEHRLDGVSGLPLGMLGDGDRPYLMTCYEVMVPPGYTLAWNAVGPDPGRERMVHDETELDDRIIHRWALNAEADGSLSVCSGDFPHTSIVPHILHAGKDHGVFMSVGEDWDTVGQAYLERIDGVFESDAAIDRLAAELTAGIEDPLVAIDRVFAEVQHRCRYLGLFEGAGGIIPIDAPVVLESGFGDCKGLSTLLISLLRAGGIDAHPVLVRTASDGTLATGIPNMAQFNHFIAWADVGADGLFLDGTLEHCPAGLIPAYDAASPVLLLRPGAVKLVDIPPDAWRAGGASYRIEGRLDDAGLLHLRSECEVTGNLGVRWRGRLDERGSRELEGLLREALFPDDLPVSLDRHELLDLEDWRAPLTLLGVGSSRVPVPSAGDDLYLQRHLGGSIQGMQIDASCGVPFDLRLIPDYSEQWSIELPAGMALVRPDTLAVAEAGVVWNCRAWQEGSTFRLARSVVFDDVRIPGDAVDLLKRTVSECQERDAGYFEIRRR